MLVVQAPAITITLTSDYIPEFSDHFELWWQPGEQPMMRNPIIPYPGAPLEEPKPLDQPHQDSVVFPDVSMIRIAFYNNPSSGPALPPTDVRMTCYTRVIGTAGTPMTLQKFVDSFHEWMDCNIAENKTLRSMMEDSKGHCGLFAGLDAPEPGEDFRGLTVSITEIPETDTWRIPRLTA